MELKQLLKLAQLMVACRQLRGWLQHHHLLQISSKEQIWPSPYRR